MIVIILTVVSVFLWPQQIIDTCSEGEKSMTTLEFLDAKRKIKVQQYSLTKVLYFYPDPSLLILRSSLSMMSIILLTSALWLGLLATGGAILHRDNVF